MALGFQRGHDDGRPEVLTEVARGDTDIPARRLPFRPFVVGEGAGRYGVDRLPAVAGLH